VVRREADQYGIAAVFLARELTANERAALAHFGSASVAAVGIVCRWRGRLHEKDVFAAHGFEKLHCNVPVRILVHSAGAYLYAQLARNAVGQGRVCRASQDQELVVHFRLRRIVWTPRDHPVRHASSSYRSNKDAASPSRLDGRQFLALRLGLEKIRISYPGARRCSLWRLQRAHGGADDLH
jgi:hypothetical protein